MDVYSKEIIDAVSCALLPLMFGTVIIMTWLSNRVKRKRNTSRICRGQKYIFHLHITLRNGQKYDFTLYSDYPYKNISDIAENTSLFPLKGEGEFIRKGKRIELLQNGRETWINSDDITVINMERRENQDEKSEGIGEQASCQMTNRDKTEE